ncbi:Aspartokinase/homoserine dehydrogenase, related [Neospora caninum Liverpool]|uniref:Aspartokinase n=1 Tax=Neospora caninum (strain Liverpool) TaxID=572307 RepID=F0VLN4_NEOCL|nr:Aspartokinase/homoserine dehydrogenase, related [Neospora caninum Liverpool]CBZ54162.1 Aspartokinase/homoserine dehydrogenase, related [Neospora caninum Liverpool]CEL68862.1 TPA: Aspartokinase/homoserine dehydrogenase, related [Neospora caninum Liverpool]|eukprot:XP_003884193.1 Aspartokinase/homoserine dehydrogenase, related [Neospora caninum Liverpool]
MKFGGSSLAAPENIRRVVGIIEQELPSRPIIVLSAVGKTTDRLVEYGRIAVTERQVKLSELHDFHEQLIKGLGLREDDVPDVWKIEEEIYRLLTGISLIGDISHRTEDLLMSYGERLSVRIVAAYMNKARGLPARALDAWDVGMKTSTRSGSSQSLRGHVDVLPSAYEAIGAFFAPLSSSYSYIPVVTGFIAKDKHGSVTTLGRSGSDFTAAVVGAAVQASEVQIWTDVDGVLTADPRVVKGARSVETISFDQASELAYFGAKVIHPKTMLPAMKHNIPVRVKNSYNPEHPGTLVVQAEPSGGDASLAAVPDGVTAVTYQRDITVVDVNSTRMLGAHGFLARLFSICDQLDISIDVVATSEVSVSLSLEKDTSEDKIEKLQECLSSFSTTSVRRGKALVSIVGNLENCNEIVARTCIALTKIGVTMQLISCGTSKVNLTFCVEDAEVHRVVQAVHDALFAQAPTAASTPSVESLTM